MAAAFEDERARARLGTQELLRRWSPAWNLVGRVHFNLAENRKDDEAPFAFLATYTSRLSAHGKAQHLPLGQALREYAGEAKKDRLLSLLLPVQRAAETCPWLRAMVDAGEIFHPLRFTPRDAFQVLSDVPRLEAAGVVLRMPASWRGHRPARPRVTATVGGKPPSGLGKDALLDFRLDVALDGEPLSRDEIARLLASTDGLALVRGQWVEVDPDRLRKTLDDLRRAEREAKANGRELRRGAADAGRGSRGGRGRRRGRGSRLVAGRGGAVARRDARGPAPAGGPRPRRARRGAANDAPPVPAVGSALALPPLQARPRRVPGRRHGPRQDDPGARAPDRAQARRGSRAAPEPAGGAGFAPRQLGRRGEPLRARPRGAPRPPFGPARRRAEGPPAGAARTAPTS